jgi:AcrR family transcriptional regulator
MSSAAESRETAPHNGERCPRLTHGARCNHVIEAAVGLFAQKGFQGTKTKEIAEAAGINEAQIFRDFQSKEKLYCAILDYAASRINTAAVIEELSGFAEHRNDEALFSHLATRFLEIVGREHTLYRLMLYCALEQHELARMFRERQVVPLERFLESYLRNRQAEGAFRNGEPHLLARSFLSMCQQHVLRHVLFGEMMEPDSLPALAKTYTRVFLDGVQLG